jgi:predicted permease
MEEKKDTTDHTTNHEHKNSGISILTVIGLSFVVIGSAFLLKKYLKRPESWSSWASKWVSGE